MASLGHSVTQPSSLHGQEISQHWLLQHLLPGEEGRAGANKVSLAAATLSSFPGLRLRKYQVHPWRVTCHGNAAGTGNADGVAKNTEHCYRERHG